MFWVAVFCALSAANTAGKDPATGAACAIIPVGAGTPVSCSAILFVCRPYVFARSFNSVARVFNVDRRFALSAFDRFSKLVN